MNEKISDQQLSEAAKQVAETAVNLIERAFARGHMMRLTLIDEYDGPRLPAYRRDLSHE